MSNSSSGFERSQGGELLRRLREPRRFLQIVAGARQVGKTTLVQQVLRRCGLPFRCASADEPTLRGATWVSEQWEAARLETGRETAILVLDEVRTDPADWGRMVESAVGAHPMNAAFTGNCEVFWWRHRNREVDFVLRRGREVAAIEVKSGRRRDSLPGMAAFAEKYPAAKRLLVGGDGIPIETFLTEPMGNWLG